MAAKTTTPTPRQRPLIGKLGRKAVRYDKRTLQLASYLDHSILPMVPAHYNWGTTVKDYGVMLNDRLGDCTCACVGHCIQVQSANAGHEVIISDSDVLSLYEAVSGYDPVTGEGDEGAFELDVLNYWRANGVAGHELSAYVSLEPGNHDHLRIATYLFGATYIGVALPISIQNQWVWSVPPGGPFGDGEPGSLGGHAVPIVGYNHLGAICVTWGHLQQMTWNFLTNYMDEAYALLTPDWFEGKNLAPSGFDLATLQSDLAAIASPNPPTPSPVAKK